MSTKLGITDHCVERFVEHTLQGSKKPLVISANKTKRVKIKIREMVSKASPVQLKPGYRANNILANGLRCSVFLRYNNWIFVINSELTTVITCYPASALRWVKLQ